MALGHPKGLFPLFFTEMWERLAFYTMVGILLLYTLDMERGGLGLPPAQGNEIYGLYLAFVYFTPFLGGMIADRFLGYRRAVLIGGLLMGTGLILMSMPGFSFFVAGIVGLVVGNGFFKPNISVMVGNIYEPGDPKRDAGFNIFYMGINVGALVATLIMAPAVRNLAGWLWTFLVAGAGVLIAVVILLTQWKILDRADRRPDRDTEATGLLPIFLRILLPAFIVGGAGFLGTFYGAGWSIIGSTRCGLLLLALVILLTQWQFLKASDQPMERDPEDTTFTEILLKILLPAFAVGGLGYLAAKLAHFTLIRPAVCGFLAGMIPVIIFFVRLGTTAREDEKPGLLALLPIYVAGGAFFMILHLNGSAMTQWARDYTDRESVGITKAVTLVNPWSEQEALPSYYVNAREDVPRPDPQSLLVVDEVEIARMYGQQRMDENAVAKVSSMPGIEVVEINTSDEETPDSWSARATSVFANGVVKVEETTGAHGEPAISVSIPDGAKAERTVTFLRQLDGEKLPVFIVDADTNAKIFDGYREKFGKEPQLLPPGQFLPVINAEVYQSWNPFFVIVLTPLVVGFFGWLVRKERGVPTARKLLYGMLLTTASLLLMSIGGLLSEGGSLKVSGLWLMSFYLVVTFGELCLSPMGLSLVTKLTPKRLVGLTMGGWFLATAFGNNFSGFFGGIQHLMSPVAFFLLLAGLSGLVALFLLLVQPKLDAAIRKYGA